MRLDITDRRILSFLQKDSKMTTKELSLHLDLSSTAVYERIKKMEKEGVIKGYSALVDRGIIGRGFVVFCQIKLLQHRHEYVVKFEREVIRFDEVLECYNVSGDYDYLLKVIVSDMKAYHDFINDKLTRMDHIGSAHSTFIIHEVKNSHVVPVLPEN